VAFGYLQDFRPYRAGIGVDIDQRLFTSLRARGRKVCGFRKTSCSNSLI
jgi:hypothetical protein